MVQKLKTSTFRQCLEKKIVTKLNIQKAMTEIDETEHAIQQEVDNQPKKKREEKSDDKEKEDINKPNENAQDDTSVQKDPVAGETSQTDNVAPLQQDGGNLSQPEKEIEKPIVERKLLIC